MGARTKSRSMSSPLHNTSHARVGGTAAIGNHRPVTGGSSVDGAASHLASHCCASRTMPSLQRFLGPDDWTALLRVPFNLQSHPIQVIAALRNANGLQLPCGQTTSWVDLAEYKIITSRRQ